MTGSFPWPSLDDISCYCWWVLIFESSANIFQDHPVTPVKLGFIYASKTGLFQNKKIVDLSFPTPTKVCLVFWPRKNAKSTKSASEPGADSGNVKILTSLEQDASDLWFKYFSHGQNCVPTDHTTWEVLSRWRLKTHRIELQVWMLQHWPGP